MSFAREDQMTFYEAVGGEETFVRLVRRFYEGVASDPVLRPIYPEEDLGPAEERLRLFLMQYWGGPRTYSERRGHPRLRMRHAPFRVGTRERDRWLAHMRAAIDELELPEAYERPLWEYMVYAAHSMVNVPDEETPATSEPSRSVLTVTSDDSAAGDTGANTDSGSDDDGDEPIRISLS